MILALVLLVVGVAIGAAVSFFVPGGSRRVSRASRPTTTGRILLPFTGTTVSRRALDAALRLAKIDDATLMPAFLATVPLTLSLDSPLPNQCTVGMPLLEAIEQRAAAQDVVVDARIERGRSYRHALSRLLERESFDRVIVSATGDPRVGLSGDDLMWLLLHAKAEVLILRAAPEDRRVVSAEELAGHF
ncbi:MAG TPA: universal stress protein [Solirubrobacteraceae bacterium]|nr:universal stress protein [Solirubrobacteraceae bacterium]